MGSSLPPIDELRIRSPQERLTRLFCEVRRRADDENPHYGEGGGQDIRRVEEGGVREKMGANRPL